MGNTNTKEEIPESPEEWEQFWADIAIQYGDDAEVDEDNIDSFDGSYSPIGLGSEPAVISSWKTAKWKM